MCMNQKELLSLTKALKTWAIEEKKRAPFLFLSHPSKKELFPHKKRKEESYCIPPITSQVPCIKKAQPSPHPEKIALAPPQENAPEIFLEPVKPLKEPLDFFKIRKVLEKSSPHIELTSSILDDEIAILRKYKWKHRLFNIDVLFLSNYKTPQEKKLVENIVQAITRLKKKTLLLTMQEAETLPLNKSSFHLIFTPALDTWQESSLYSLVTFDENKAPFIGKTPLFSLPPIESLLSDVKQKEKLWHFMKQKLI